MLLTVCLCFQPFNNWLDTTKLDLVDMFIVHSIEEIQELYSAHEVFKQTLPEADKEFNAILRLSQEAMHLSSNAGIKNPENPYTTVHPQVCTLLSCEASLKPCVLDQIYSRYLAYTPNAAISVWTELLREINLVFFPNPLLYPC